MRLNIGAKLGVGFGALLVLLTGFGVYVNNSSSQTIESIDLLAQYEERNGDVQEIVDRVIHTRLAVSDFILNKDEKSKAACGTLTKETNEVITRVADHFTVREEHDRIQAIGAEYAVYTDAAAEMIDEIIEAETTRDKQFNPAGAAAIAALDAAPRPDDEADANVIDDARIFVLNTRLIANRYLGDPDDANRELATKAISGYVDNVKSIAEKAKSAELKASMDKVVAAAEDYTKHFADVRDAYVHRNETLTTKLNPAAAKLEKLTDEVAATVAKAVDAESDATKARASTALKVGWGALGVSLVVGIATALWLTRLITGALRPVSARADQIAAKDLTGEPLVIRSQDELGDLTNSMNTMSDSLRSMVAELTASAQEVASASTQIAASSEEISAGLSQQQAQVSQISSAAEEMSASATDIARKATEANTEAGAAGAAAEEGAKTVQSTVTGMGRIADTVNQTGASVQELGKRGDQIGQIIEVITDIADQTNLLALNAAIEAARAGEHGRGFAVVADEVRKLAERTVKATEEVSSSIQAIQGETGQAIGRMNACTQEVEGGVKFANEAGQSLRAIVNKSQAVVGGIRSIAAAAEQQAAATEQVTRSVESIVSVGQQAAAGATESAAAASQLSAKAESLRELVSRFKVNSAPNSACARAA